MAFNGTVATFNVVSATQINTTVPGGATTGKIRVTTPAGFADSASDFTVPFDFSLSPPPNNITVAQGSSGSNTITATLVSGTSQPVTFSAAGLPSGATASAPSCTPTCTSTLTITTTSSTLTGLYTITVRGTGGGLTRKTQFKLHVRK